MDGSILCEARLLEASRDFVCARLVTYEDAKEGEFLKKIGGSNKLDVANTTFVLLSPDGRTPLSGSGRAPKQSFKGTEQETLDGLLTAMKQVSTTYPGNGETKKLPPVPYVADVRKALNVAACDNQPLVVVLVADKAKRTQIEQDLAKLAWASDFRGRFSFVKSASPTDFEEIRNAPKKDAIFVVQPGTYGLTGKTIAVAARQDATGLRKMLNRSLAVFDKQPMDRGQLKAGKRNGVSWEAESMDTRTEKKRRKGRQLR